MLKKHSLSIAVLAALAASSASAGLYISPVVRDSVVIDLPDSKKAEKAGSSRHHANSSSKSLQNNSVNTKFSGDSDTQKIRGRSNVHGEFLIAEDSASAHKVFRFGENVPLFVALEKVVPDSADWNFNIEDGLENHSVSWDGGQTWEGVLSAITKENRLSISVNHSDKSIGVAAEARVADALASRNAKVYRLSPKKTLRENLREWAELGGYKKVVYASEVYDVDYPVPEAVFIGPLNVKGGSLDQLLTALNKDADTPLSAEFKEANKIILISKKTSKKEMY
jgi:hypothetical protein